MKPTLSNKPALVSIVIPCFNESEGIFHCHNRLQSVLRTLPVSTEVIYVNDGSEDDTLDVLKIIRSRDPHVGLVNLSRNFGKEAALTAGIDHADGDAVIVLDADLQDPPECIPEMIAAWRRGYDVVAMKRAERHGDSLVKRESAKWFYKLLSLLSDVHIPGNVGDFRLLSRRAVDALKAMPERNRYMKGLFSWIGFNTIELSYTRDARSHGHSKWPLHKLIGLALDGITSFSIVPLRIASVIGLAAAAGAFLYGFIFLVKASLVGDPVAGFPTLIITITFLGGIQLLAIGLLGEYVGRLLIEGKQRPVYFVESANRPGTSQIDRLEIRRAEGAN